MLKKEGYKLLSDLIFKGFLVMGVKIAGKYFVFKTVNEREFDQIKLYSGFSHDAGYTSRFNLNYLVSSLLLIDNENVLIRKDYEFKNYYDFFSKLPYIVHLKIIKELLDLRNIAFEAILFVEGFSYTDQSRKKWLFMKDSPNSASFTGIPGTDKIGINVYQESWILINKMLDAEEQYNKDFSLAILVASANNPKGARTIRGKHDAAFDRADERRKKLARKGTHKEQSWKPEGWAAPVDTAEELVSELMRQMEGRKDKHDHFIDDYMKKLREQAEDQTRQAEDRLKEIRKRREKEKDIPDITSDQRILTAEEMQKLNSKDHNNLMIVESEEIATEKDKDRFLSKIGSKVLTARK